MDKYYIWFQKNWINVLLGIYIFFIIYTTIVPFNFITDIGQLRWKSRKVYWIPLFMQGAIISRSDILANVIFFIPLGGILALRKILRYYRIFLIQDWFRITLFGAGLSFIVEFIQFFTYDRRPSINDVLMNAVGTFLGALFVLLIYIKFRRRVKQVLEKIFIRKPEFIIAGIILLFIFIAQSAPFTFKPSLYFITAQLREFWSDPFKLNNIFNTLLMNIFIYGTFSYFTFFGIGRYFLKSVSFSKKILIFLLLLAVPFILEIYQLILPHRNHTLSEVFFAQAGIVFGTIIASYQYILFRKKISQHETPRLFFRYQHAFLLGTGLLYFVFLLKRTFSPLYVASLHSIWNNITHPENMTPFWFMEFNRLNLLIVFTKEVFAFLPAGFIISLLLKHCRNRLLRYALYILLIIFFIGIFYLKSITLSGIFLGIEIFAILLGFGLGYLCWQFYIYMMFTNAK